LTPSAGNPRANKYPSAKPTIRGIAISSIGSRAHREAGQRHNEDDDDRILKDGERLHVSMFAMDGRGEVLPALDAKHYGLYPAGPGVKEGGACTIDGRPGHLKKVEGGFLCVPVGEDAMSPITDSQPAMVVDAFGNGGLALNRPGSRYLTAGRLTTDHAVQVTRELERRRAYADSVCELQDAWKSSGPSDREIQRIHDTGDPVRDAYLDQKYDLETAWSRGSGRR
jgi:hypothetical protein